MPTIPRLACTANAVASSATALRHRSCTEAAGNLGSAASAESSQAILRPPRLTLWKRDVRLGSGWKGFKRVCDGSAFEQVAAAFCI